MKPVDAGLPPKFTLREDRVAGTTDTWRAWAEATEVEEWTQSVGGCLKEGWNEQYANSQGPRHYEFPTGYNNYFTAVERFAVGEQFFTHSAQLQVRLAHSSAGLASTHASFLRTHTQASNPNLPKTIPNLIMSSISQCDLDLRQVLIGNVVLTGGGSLFSGFADRLSLEMSRHFQHVSASSPALCNITLTLIVGQDPCSRQSH